MIKKTTLLTLTLTFGCLAGDIVINPQAEHSHVKTVFVVCTNCESANENW
ncbi:hypothetical protein JW935_17405 [candidate division KSB1 bacterium]|nr:hypothetical protein [candidate division KSB1 bacterium]